MALKNTWTGSQQYICDRELAQAFHMARNIGMPLLIEGEPGTGKTELPIQYAQDQNWNYSFIPLDPKVQ
jgi:MoxR-like ATPase